VPEVEFTIDTTSGELRVHVHGVAGPGCDDVANLVKDLAGEPEHQVATAEYHLRPSMRARAETRLRSRRG
jgi:hypothetical protein